MIQNTSGVKDDIIAALLLHPECEECLSLIARVFPGKTTHELMLSHEASTVRTKLDTEMKRVAKLYTSRSDKASSSDTIPPIASQYLEGIELKMAESAEEKLKLDTTTSVVVPSLGATKPPHVKCGSHCGSLSAKSQASRTESRTSAGNRAAAAKSSEETDEEFKEDNSELHF